MAEYGISTWDANGVYNNYGIKPVTVVDTIHLSTGQVSGRYSFTIPPGTKVGFTISTEMGTFATNSRKIVASGNTITISQTNQNDLSGSAFPANECYLVVFLENA